MFRAAKQLGIYNGIDSTAVDMAVRDLTRDFRNIRGIELITTDISDNAEICISSGLAGASEQYRIGIGGQRINIQASDELGAVYAIYRLSREALGVEPMWFWKDSYPEACPERILELEEREICSQPPVFKYRGWFLNDEDLLTGWLEGSGPRHIDYPHYAQVISLDIAEAVYESALRSEANLIIPASFLDVMNPCEAQLITRAVARGLYVTQHHIEPLGVSHFGFENYWKARGEKVEFSYGNEPARVRQTWLDFARKWYELAGDQVLWQLGLRGKGDRSIWQSDKSVSREDAGKFISRAFREQMEIVKEVDPRPEPPATTTLWAEMSDLMAGGELELPRELITIFCDHGRSQDMGDDFFDTPRTPERKTGIYYHIAFWIRGAHLVQGIHPAKIERVMRSAIARGDTEYAIINVSNIREHTIGIEAAMNIMSRANSWSLERFMRDYAGGLSCAYDRFFSAFAFTPEGMFQDGDAVLLLLTLEYIRESELSGKINDDNWLCHGLDRYDIATPAKRHSFQRLLELKAEELEVIADSVSPKSPQFHLFNLEYQSRLLAATYRTCVAAIKAIDHQVSLNQVANAIKHMLDLQVQAEYGKWKNWYRGSTKSEWHNIRKRLIELAHKE